VLERRAIIARRLVRTTRAAIASSLPILLPHGTMEWKKIRPGRSPKKGIESR
jgi:hypothetical protein